MIKVEIINDNSFENDEAFKVQLTDVVGEDTDDKNNAKLNHILECKVNILNDDTLKSFSDRVTALLGFNGHTFELGKATWWGQIKEQLRWPSGPDSSLLGYLSYIIMFPWSVFNAVSPPTTIGGGWLTFAYALGCVGITTAIIGGQ